MHKSSFMRIRIINIDSVRCLYLADSEHFQKVIGCNNVIILRQPAHHFSKIFTSPVISI